MSFTVENKVFWRRIVLALFILSLLGPWIYDQLNVPAKYPCAGPSFRLEGDYCGYPMSGFLVFSMLIGRFFIILWELITGTFTGQARELFVGLSLPPIIPFFTTALSIWKKETHRLQTINLVAWILACVSTMMFIFYLKDHLVINLWGLWLYVVMAVGAIIIETRNKYGK